VVVVVVVVMVNVVDVHHHQQVVAMVKELCNMEVEVVDRYHNNIMVYHHLIIWALVIHMQLIWPTIITPLYLHLINMVVQLVMVNGMVTGLMMVMVITMDLPELTVAHLLVVMATTTTTTTTTTMAVEVEVVMDERVVEVEETMMVDTVYHHQATDPWYLAIKNFEANAWLQNASILSYIIHCYYYILHLTIQTFIHSSIISSLTIIIKSTPLHIES
jgi:hypothetical protein